MAQENGDHVPAADQGTVENAGIKKSKAEKHKDKKKKQKLNKQLRKQQQAERQASNGQAAPSTEDGDDEDIVIEYVSAPLELEGLSLGDGAGAGEDEPSAHGLGLGFSSASKDDPFADFKRVFEKFASAEQVTGIAPLDGEEQPQETEKPAEKAEAKDADEDTADTEDPDKEGGDKKLTKKQRKALAQLKIAELKRLCERPDVVEVWDVTSQDPQLLVYLKAYRNTVAVPRHWSQKRKYLQGKRGLEKPPFKLPDFIEATGIGKMREAYTEKEDAKKLKQKQREKMQPKMGRLDIDYQVLHDAFFKHQTRPKLTQLGDIYYEGKEFESKMEGAKPGVLSAELKNALGMSAGNPPPWLINMQRYGPPPSYPNLRVPGLNAPIPAGCQFGYQPGGWGKPPVDETGNPVYGNVFGADDQDIESDEEVDKASRWGELEPELEESEEEEEEEEEEPDEDALADGIASGIASGISSGLVSGLASGIASSLPSGIETPNVSVQLRKGSDSVTGGVGGPGGPKQLYTVLEQKAAPIGQSTLLGTDHVYVIPGADKGKKTAGGPPGKGGVNDVEVTLTPEEIEGLDEAGIKALYEQKVAEARGDARREDFSDLVAQRAAQQKRKMQQKTDGTKKQKTDFKF